jgi:hypothetical protein
MGRYYTGDIEGKFWFASQPTSDLLEFGEDRNDSNLNVVVYYDNLKEIEDKINLLKKSFKKRFKITYKIFLKKMDQKGYQSSSKDKETQTKKWDKMCREASKLELGLKILKALKEKKDDLYIEGEL